MYSVCSFIYMPANLLSNNLKIRKESPNSSLEEKEKA